MKTTGERGLVDSTPGAVLLRSNVFYQLNLTFAKYFQLVTFSIIGYFLILFPAKVTGSFYFHAYQVAKNK